jgi:hypothetical protein
LAVGAKGLIVDEQRSGVGDIEMVWPVLATVGLLGVTIGQTS